jgi:hypothetical protein
VAISISAGVATLVPAASFSGVRDLVFTATDPLGGSHSDTLRLTVLRVNQAPVLSPLPDTTLAPGDTLRWDLSPFAADPDDAPSSLVWSVTGAARTRASLFGSLLTLIAPRGASYAENLVVSVFDLFGLADADTLRLSVQPIPPPIANVPDVEFDSGKIFELPLSPYLSGTITSLSAFSDTALQVLINTTTRVATISALNMYKGTARLVFQATNSLGKTARDTIQVTIANTPPTVSGLPEIFLDAGLSAQLELDSYARDDEGLSLLKWTAFPDPGLQVSIHAGLRTATITASPDLSGLALVVFQATDAQGATGSDTLLVNVHGVQADTAVTTPPDTMVTTPPDTMVTTPPDTTVSDTTSTSPPGTSNRAPTISGIPDLEFHRDVSPRISLDRYVGDDGFLRDLAWTASPEPGTLLQVAIDASRTATITALQDTGLGRIIFRVADPQGLSARDTVQVVVRPPRPAPQAGDFDRDGHLTLDDFFLFVEALGLTALHPDWNPAFDLNQDGKISFDDFFLFVDAFKKNNVPQKR